MEMNFPPLFYVGLLLLLAFFAGQLAFRLRLPRITGYLIIGVIFGPSALGVFPEKIVNEEFSFIVDLALGFIAFSIGGSLKWRGIKKLGNTILVITFTQAIGAFIIVFCAIYILFPLITGLPFFNGGNELLGSKDVISMGIIVGAMSAATAPGAVLALIHQYRSKGKFTNILLGIVALDDALAIAMFSFALPVAMVILTSATTDFIGIAKEVYFEISLSIALGFIMGYIFKYISKFAKSRQEILALITGTILVLYGITLHFKASPILSNMVFGFFVINSAGRSSSIFDAVEDIEEPVFSMFFALAGTHMDLSILLHSGILGVILVAARFLGKFGGTMLGGMFTGLETSQSKYLGLGLLPKAGVTVALLIEAGYAMGENYVTSLMLNTVLASIIINEIIAPFFVKYALFKSGEVISK